MVKGTRDLFELFCTTASEFTFFQKDNKTRHKLQILDYNPLMIDHQKCVRHSKRY